MCRNAHLRHSTEDDHLLRSVFYKWTTWVQGRKDLRERWLGYHKKLDRNMRNRMFLAFVEVVRERRCVRGLVKRQLQKSNRKLLNRCFQGWISFMQVSILFCTISLSLESCRNMLKTCNTLRLLKLLSNRTTSAQRKLTRYPRGERKYGL